jgi:hypothetical protein
MVIHLTTTNYNAQVTNLLLSSLEKDEYGQVDEFEKENEMWETL